MVKDVGYASQPLDGIWLRAPYLHNGSVPSLTALLDAARRAPDRVLARLRHLRPRRRRLPRHAARRRLPARLPLRHDAPRRRQRRPHLRHHAAPRREGGADRVPEDALTPEILTLFLAYELCICCACPVHERIPPCGCRRGRNRFRIDAPKKSARRCDSRHTASVLASVIVLSRHVAAKNSSPGGTNDQVAQPFARRRHDPDCRPSSRPSGPGSRRSPRLRSGRCRAPRPPPPTPTP